ncbi:conserved hypothetical protein [Streptomyces lividans TK24]|nr:conserved hypothetical protein [Streptomyces lividans TK24]
MIAQAGAILVCDQATSPVLMPALSPRAVTPARSEARPESRRAFPSAVPPHIHRVAVIARRAPASSLTCTFAENR